MRLERLLKPIQTFPVFGNPVLAPVRFTQVTDVQVFLINLFGKPTACLV